MPSSAGPDDPPGAPPTGGGTSGNFSAGKRAASFSAVSTRTTNASSGNALSGAAHNVHRQLIAYFIDGASLAASALVQTFVEALTLTE